MKDNNQKTKVTRLEENQKRLEENIGDNVKRIEDLAKSFNSFVNNHFQTFETKVVKQLAEFDIKLKNNTKLTWFLLSSILGLYALVIYLVR